MTKMTQAQQASYDKGRADRMAGKPMVESFALTPHVANAYLNGYVAACEAIEEARIKKLANNQLDRLVREEPENKIAQRVYRARREAYRVPAFTQSSGREGWYE